MSSTLVSGWPCPPPAIHEVPYTCTLEDLVLYYVNSKRLRPIGYIHEFSREGTPFPYRPPHTIAPRLHDDAVGQLRLLLTAYQTFREIHRFSEGSFNLSHHRPELRKKERLPSGRRVRVPLEVTGIHSDCADFC